MLYILFVRFMFRNISYYFDLACDFYSVKNLVFRIRFNDDNLFHSKKKEKKCHLLSAIYYFFSRYCRRNWS